MSLVRSTLLEDGTLLDIQLTNGKFNILTTDVMAAVSEVLRTHMSAAHLRLVVLRGSGGNFSFGASVDEHLRDVAPDMLDRFNGFVRHIAEYPVPVAALVEGRCLGGAFEAVLACHLAFATSSAQFGCPEVRLGVFPPVLAVLGPLRLPGALSERLLLTGGTLDAHAAERAGLVAEVFEEDAMEGLLSWYRKHLAPLSAYTLRQAVTASRAGSHVLTALQGPLDRVTEHYVDTLLDSHDGNEGIEAFIEKRPPIWTDA